jgi:CheY-like chemotaxis protein/ketosteroid isomerase-like protein
MPELLLVDDDADLREALLTLVTDEGYTAQEADSLECALALVDAQVFDLILTDCLSIDGRDPLAGVAALCERAAPTPVGVMTGWHLSPEEVRAAGFAFLVAKPFDLDQLMLEIAAGVHTALRPEQELAAGRVAQYFAALSARDWDGLAALCTEDVTYTLPGTGPLAVTIAGKAAFRAYTEQTFANFPGATFDHVVIYGTPNGLAARYQSHWRDSDGREQQQAGAIVLEFVGPHIGRIGVRLHDAQLRQLLMTAAAPIRSLGGA